MEHRFNALARALTSMESRRTATTLAGSLVLSLLAPLSTSAAKKRRKSRLCVEGQTIRVGKKKRKRLLKQGATRGACADCPGSQMRCETECVDPQSDPTNCGTCGTVCAAGQACYQGACTAVCQDETVFTWGQAVADAAPGATIRLCPGTYYGHLLIRNDLTIIGAGRGEGGTILRRNGPNDFGIHRHVVSVWPGVAATLQNLTITDGGGALGGGGVDNAADLTLIDVDVTDSRAAQGGGIFNVGSMRLINSNVLRNLEGGGIHNRGTLTVESGSRIADNSAGITNEGTLTVKKGVHITDNVAGIVSWEQGEAILEAGSRVTGNTVGIHRYGGVVSLETDAIVTDNFLDDGVTLNNCEPVDTIPNCIG